MRKRPIFLVACALILAACGGGGGLDDVIDGEDVFGSPPPTNDDGSFDSGAGDAGAVSVTADPSTGWVEADGNRFEFEAVGAVHYSCEIFDDRASINFQTNGPSFLIQGSKVADGWLLNLTFTGEDSNIQYSALLPGEGSLGLGDGQLSYDGPIDKVVDRDILNPTAVDAKVAVNCNLPGGQPTAVIDGTEYVVSMVGAGSVQCEVSQDEVTVQINRLTSDGTNIDIGVVSQDGAWVGHVVVTTPEGTFTAKDSPNPVGVTVDGSTVSYSGPFTGGASDVEGSVTITCP